MKGMERIMTTKIFVRMWGSEEMQIPAEERLGLEAAHQDLVGVAQNFRNWIFQPRFHLTREEFWRYEDTTLEARLMELALAFRSCLRARDPSINPAFASYLPFYRRPVHNLLLQVATAPNSLL